MNRRIITLAIAVGSLGLLLSTATFAEPIKYVGPNALRQLCNSNNGTFLPPTADSPVYVCLRRATWSYAGA
jgi:hypothetical protein